MRALALACFLAVVGTLCAADLPAKPTTYVHDTAGILPDGVEGPLEEKLAAFDRETSTQVLVATFPRVPEGFVLEDFTQRTAEAWGVGRKDASNGAVLFVFPEDRQLRIEVGYGLEGALPDVTAGRIIADEIVPSFRGGNMAAGIAQGVDAILAATRGEYSVATPEASPMSGGLIVVIVFVVILILVYQANKAGMVYGPGGGRAVNSWDLKRGGGGFSSRRSSGGGFSSGGGGFSGGGGSFGGGGASGRW